MTTETEIQTPGAIIMDRIVACFNIPDALSQNGIRAIRAMVFRGVAARYEMIVDIRHGNDIGLIGNQLDLLVTHWLGNLKLEESFMLESEVHAGKLIVCREIRGDLVIVEYLSVEGADDRAGEFAKPIAVFLGVEANRNW